VIKYNSYKSLSKHNYTYHKVDVVQENTTKPFDVVQNVVENVVLENKENTNKKI